MKSKFAGTISIILLSFILLSTSVLWAEETFSDGPANDDKETIHVYDGINLTNKTDFSYARSTLIKSIYPELNDLDDDSNAGVVGFNEIVVGIIKQNVADFKNKVKENQASLDDHSPLVNKNTMTVDFNTSVIKAGKTHLISVRFSMQGLISGMTHPYHEHDVLNYDLTNNTELKLADLFNPDADYLTCLSNYARENLKKHLAVKNLIDEGTSPKPENFAVWNLKSNGILFTFEESQVAPYIYGAQTILIPYSALKEIISPDSPIIACTKSKRGCSSNHLLTGGFIDEARVKQHTSNVLG